MPLICDYGVVITLLLFTWWLPVIITLRCCCCCTLFDTLRCTPLLLHSAIVVVWWWCDCSARWCCFVVIVVTVYVIDCNLHSTAVIVDALLSECSICCYVVIPLLRYTMLTLIWCVVWFWCLITYVDCAGDTLFTRTLLVFPLWLQIVWRSFAHCLYCPTATRVTFVEFRCSVTALLPFIYRLRFCWTRTRFAPQRYVGTLRCCSLIYVTLPLRVTHCTFAFTLRYVAYTRYAFVALLRWFTFRLRTPFTRFYLRVATLWCPHVAARYVVRLWFTHTRCRQTWFTPATPFSAANNGWQPSHQWPFAIRRYWFPVHPRALTVERTFWTTYYGSAGFVVFSSFVDAFLLTLAVPAACVVLTTVPQPFGDHVPPASTTAYRRCSWTFVNGQCIVPALAHPPVTRHSFSTTLLWLYYRYSGSIGFDWRTSLLTFFLTLPITTCCTVTPFVTSVSTSMLNLFSIVSWTPTWRGSFCGSQTCRVQRAASQHRRWTPTVPLAVQHTDAVWTCQTFPQWKNSVLCWHLT